MSSPVPTTPLKNLIVLGGTGKQGGALIRALAASDRASEFAIYTPTRNPKSASALRLAELDNVHVIKADFYDADAVFDAVGAPVWGVFCMGSSLGKGESVEKEERQGKNFVRAAVINKVKHFVYSSVDRGGDARSATDPTVVPHFANKHRVEQYLIESAKQTGMTYTILRPVAFFDNYTNDFFGKVFMTIWKQTVTKPLQFVAVSDIGWFGAEAFLLHTAPAYHNAAISLAGGEYTFDEFKKEFEATTGKPLLLTYAFVARAILAINGEFAAMMKWFETDGYGADIDRVKQIHPHTLGLRGWLREQSAWKVRK